jgi:ATP-dependent helicase/nuclease subunit A
MSDTLAIDRESRRVIREELLTNLLVEAGAGSGKTQMLAERMAAGVATGAYRVEQMAAVTFTRKAASELRGRFHLALERRLAHVGRNFSSGTSAESDRLRAALGNLERFFAGTIHSFCARLLRERPVESGVSPGFTELDEVQDEELRNRSWRDFIVAARAAGDSEMLALLETGVRPKDLDQSFAIVCGNDDVEFPTGDADCPDPAPAVKALETFWKTLQKHLPQRIDEDTTCKLQKAAREHQRMMRVMRNQLGRASVVAALLEPWDCESKITQNRWADSPADKKRVNAIVVQLHEAFRMNAVEPFLRQWRAYVYRLSVGLLSRARAHAAAERRRRNSLNYGDLLILTAKVLRENAQVRAALQRKYRHLFVDEFQDTDPVQAEIVFLLAAGDSDVGRAFRSGSGSTDVGWTLRSGSTADWRTVPIRPGALFVVGDPKQSIYRFRRADIEIYNTVRERFSDPAVGRVVPLTMNFRSVPALCDWANGVFVNEFPKEPTQHSPRFAPLDPDPQKKGLAGGIFTLTHACPDYRDVPAEDAAKIARYIRAEVDAGRRRFSDFLILTRKKNDRLAPYAKALEALNVPIEVSGAGAFGESQEVAALTALLRALADPEDSLPLIAVLRGPFFGISDADLFAFKQAGGWFSVFSQPKNDRPATVVDGAIEALGQYYRWTRVLPAGAALDRILEHSGYLALASTTPGGVEAGDLLHAIDRVRHVTELGGSLADAADALEAGAEASNEVESLPLEPGRTDVVRLMNLHKAKGLEAPVLFLADPCGGMRQHVDVHIERRGAQAVGWFKVEKKSEGSYAAKLLGEHPDWATHEQAEIPFLENEEKRLLYVAATRAREILVISRHVPPRASQAWGALNGSLQTATELAVPSAAVVQPNQPLDCAESLCAAAQAELLASAAAITPASWSITSVTAEAKNLKGRESPPADDATRVVAQTTSSHRADMGMAWGTLIHGLLEHAMRHEGATRDDLRRLAMWLTLEEPRLREVIDEALDTVGSVSEAAFWQEALSAEHSVETPFAVSTCGRAIHSGVVDLAYGSHGVWSLIDYKSDVALSRATPQPYQEQLAQYRTALEACGVSVLSAAIHAVRLGQAGLSRKSQL